MRGVHDSSESRRLGGEVVVPVAGGERKRRKRRLSGKRDGRDSGSDRLRARYARGIPKRSSQQPEA